MTAPQPEPTAPPPHPDHPAGSEPAQRQRAGLVSTLDGIVVGASVLAFCVFLFAVARRLRYPFELEWMEGAVLDHVRVVLSGQPLYRAPSVAFTPFLYTPFYYAVCALLARVFGVGFVVARAVSLASILGSFLLIADFVRRETRDLTASIAAAGMFVATYELTGFWFDLARVDSLFLLLLLLGTWLGRFGKSHTAAAAAAIALFLAFFTKQTGLALALPGLAFAFLTSWRRGILAVTLFAALSLGAVAWMNHVSHGWFAYYVFDVPSQHQMLWDRWATLLLQFFWAPVAVPMLLSLLAFVSPAIRRHGWLRWACYLCLTVLALGASYSGLLHRDGYVNVLTPGYAVVAIVGGLAYAWIRSHAQPSASSLRCFASAAIVLGFAVLAYDVTRALPTARDVYAGREMVRALRQVRGPVWAPGAGFVASMAGHDEIGAHAMGIADIFKTRDGPTRDRLRQEIIATLRQKRYPSIVFDRGWELMPPELTQELRASYRLETKLFPSSMSDACWPRTGFHTRPEELWVPR
jgi:hypothetical protein